MSDSSDHLPSGLDSAGIPQHVAIIMDGNGRWAKQRGKPRIEGHRQGVENVREIVDTAREMGLRYLTLYAFSAENWKRPQKEVQALMSLLERFLKRYTSELDKNGIRLHTIGDISALPPEASKALRKALDKTAHHEAHHLVLAVNYGARQEMLAAVQRYAEAARSGQVDPKTLDWPTLANYLDTAEIPDPDLLIRTSGETRLSNFLLTQCAYSELYFSSLYWPDFKRDAFVEAVRHYQQRERRFGLTGEQVNATLTEVS